MPADIRRGYLLPGCVVVLAKGSQGGKGASGLRREERSSRLPLPDRQSLPLRS